MWVCDPDSEIGFPLSWLYGREEWGGRREDYIHKGELPALKLISRGLSKKVSDQIFFAAVTLFHNLAPSHWIFHLPLYLNTLFKNIYSNILSVNI